MNNAFLEISHLAAIFILLCYCALFNDDFTCEARI